eukprot:1126354-Pelagomonas_calceolata.AAC.4
MSDFAGEHWGVCWRGHPSGQVWTREERPLPACPCCKLPPPIWHRVAGAMMLIFKLQWAQLVAWDAEMCLLAIFCLRKGGPAMGKTTNHWVFSFHLFSNDLLIPGLQTTRNHPQLGAVGDWIWGFGGEKSAVHIADN